MKLRYQVIVEGRVQGVGFRPFVAATAIQLGLSGWVRNIRQSVVIEVEGDSVTLAMFFRQLEDNAPVVAKIAQINKKKIDNKYESDFQILASSGQNDGIIDISPDLGICPRCQQELFTRGNRRYRYPFISCPQCGPRYSILKSLPFDRSHTTLKAFPLCDACLLEYRDPNDRRFHAQGINCADCGPQISYVNLQGRVIAQKEQALISTINALRAGKILAVKGLTGFHIILDASNHEAVVRLRKRKQRPQKPFALMYPLLSLVAADCHLSKQQASLLSSAIAPIVLLKNKHCNAQLSVAIAPGNPYLGVMLPYTPLHQLISREINKPLVVTSANYSGEPVCCNNHQALTQLNQLVDGFVMHDRDIYQGLDDSIVKFVDNQPMLLRRSRGYVPDYFALAETLPTVMALGGQLKNSIAFNKGKRLYMSQYLGDLDNLATVHRHLQTQAVMQDLLAVEADLVACDQHPCYTSTQLAKQSGLPINAVQHHLAHLYAAMLEHQIEKRAFGVVWDGNGYAPEGVLWGGEFIAVNGDKSQRVASFLTFKLPGGEAAIKEPARVAFALLYEIYGEQGNTIEAIESLSPFSRSTLKQLQTMLTNNINSPLTSSVGRLFDGVASLLGLLQFNSFEGEAAMSLEFAAQKSSDQRHYNMPVDFSVIPNIIDWRPMLVEILTDINKGVSPAIIGKRFHNSAAAIILKIARYHHATQVLLTGGCMQNALLLETTKNLLEKNQIKALWQQKIPPNDASLCIGQINALCFSKQAEEGS